jgi:hypothetical protein
VLSYQQRPKAKSQRPETKYKEQSTNSMAKKSLIAKAARKPKFRCVPIRDVNAAAVREVTCESSTCAASVFASWHSRAKSLALLSRAGKNIADLRFQISDWRKSEIYNLQSEIGVIHD